VGLTRLASRYESWAKLEKFVLRYAAPGSIVKVFCLHPKSKVPKQVSEITKDEKAPYQPPGCNKEALNGFKLPIFFQIPIVAEGLDPNALVGWDKAKANIMVALGNKISSEGDWTPDPIEHNARAIDRSHNIPMITDETIDAECR